MAQMWQSLTVVQALLHTPETDDSILVGKADGTYETRTLSSGEGTSIDVGTAGEISIDVDVTTISGVAPTGDKSVGDHVFLRTVTPDTYGWEPPPSAAVDLGYTANARTITNTAGDNAVLPEASTTVSGLIKIGTGAADALAGAIQQSLLQL